MAFLDELQTFTDILAALQRQVNDISVILQGHGTRLDDSEQDITDLQDPPSGVPLPLLEWLTTHTIREVDAILDTDINSIVSDVSDNATAISDVSDALDAEIADRVATDGTFSSVDTDLQNQITANLATLTQEITDRGSLANTFTEGLDAVNDRVDDVQNDLSILSTSSSTASDSLSSQIASLSSSLQTAQTQIALLQGIGVDPLSAQASQITALTSIANDALTTADQEVIDRANADALLQSSINSLNTSISGINSGLTDEKNERINADNDIEADVSSLTALATGNDALITAETAARTAADAVLQSSIDDNTGDIADNANDISDEITNRTNADIGLQTQVTTNTANLTAANLEITNHSANLVTLNGKYGVVKDGSGYITNWWVNDGLSAPGAFNLKNLNNDARLQNPGYVGKYFTPTANLAVTLPVTYDFDWGGATVNLFRGTDTNDYTRNVKVYNTLSFGLTGSCFMGVDFSTGGSTQRLGQVLTTFKVDFSGVTNRYVSLWYRIKNLVTDNTDRWFPVAEADNTMSGVRTYEYARGQTIVQISATSNKVFEFGLTGLRLLDATMADTTKDTLYGASYSVTAINMVTIA